MADELVLSPSQEWQEALADGAPLRSALDGSQDPSWISHQGRIRYLNDAALDLFQHSRDEMLGKRATDVLIVGDPEARRRTLETAKARGVAQQMGWVTRQDGSVVPLEFRITQLDESLLLAVARDMSAWVQAQDEIRASEDELRRLFDSANDIIYTLGPEGRITYMNATGERLTGYGRAELETMDALLLVVPEHRELAERMVSGQLAGASNEAYELDLLTKHGARVTVELSYWTLEREGKPWGIQGIARDITERRTAENALQASEEKFRSVVENAPAIILELDLEGNILFTSGELSLQAGASVGGTIYDFMLPRQRAIVRKTLRDVRRNGQPASYETGGPPMDVSGQPSWWACRVAPLRRDGAITGYTVIASNISERKRTEDALRKARREAEILSAIAREVTELLDRDAVLDLVDSWARELTESQFSWLAVRQPAGDFVVAREHGMEGELLRGRVTRFEAGLAKEAMQQSAAVSANDLRNEMKLAPADRKAPESLGVRAIALTPVMLDGELQALMMVARDQEGGYGQGDRDLLTRLGSLVSGALRNALLYGELDAANQELEAALESAQELATAAQEATSLKSEFLATMSHEIRTSLSGIIGMLDLLRGPSLTSEQAEYVGIAHNSANVLLELINDILDFSKIEAQSMALDLLDLETRQLVESAAELLAARAQAKGLAFSTSIADDVPPVIHGDLARLRQVLINLIGNAVKFTEQGEIEVRVEFEHGPENDAERRALRFSVRDTGIGLSEVARRRLFQPFTQADGSTTRRYGGTGLGLAISKRLVELMGGGRIDVESVEGEGSTFWFRLPYELGSATVADLAPAAALPRRPAAGESESPAGAPATPGGVAPRQSPDLRVLLAEDNPVNQRVTRIQLESLGLQLEIAANGSEALAAHQEAPFDLILMDCQMPEMEGFEASRSIRRREVIGGDRVPIIALTANALQGDREACLAAGMDDYLPKPVTLDQLEAMLARWLPRRKEDATPGRDLVETGDEIEETSLLDHEQLDLLRALGADDDRSLATEIVELFAADLPGLVAAMREALDTTDAESLRIHAHSLKGSAANMGASELSKRAASIEQRAAAGNLAGLAQPLCEIELLSARVIAALRHWAEAA